MATLEQIAEGIRRAHAAGDADSVRRLGEAYRAMQAQQVAPQGTFSDLRDAGMIRQDPGQEDLWMPDAAPASSGGDAWRRGILAPIEKNTETGAFRPAVPQIALDAWGALTLPGDVVAGKVPDLMPGTSFRDMSDETAHRAFDLSGMATVGVPAGPPGLMTPQGQRPPSPVADALRRDGLGAQQINEGVAALGPGGRVMDLGPSTQGLTTAIARTPGEGQSNITNFLRERAFEARDRIQPQVDDILGPSLSTGQFSANLRDLRSATSPLYNTAFDNASPVNVQPIVSSVDDLIGQTVGTGQSRLQSVRNMFQSGDALTEDPRILFAIRNEIDDLLDSPDVGRVASNLRDVRAAVDAELAAKVPGIKDADARWQEIARQQEGFDSGRSIFQQGQEAVDPRDLGPRLEQGVVPAGQFIGPSGETFALSQGARNELDRLIGTGSQNRTNLATAIRGDGSWNRQKLSQLFGEEKADQIIRLFDSEARMAQTEAQAIGGSVTASAQAAQRSIEPRSVIDPIIDGPFLVNPGNAARRIAQLISGPMGRRAADSRNSEIARLLMEQGGWYENRMSSPATLSLIRALLVGGDPSKEEGILDGIGSRILP